MLNIKYVNVWMFDGALLAFFYIFLQAAFCEIANFAVLLVICFYIVFTNFLYSKCEEYLYMNNKFK